MLRTGLTLYRALDFVVKWDNGNRVHPAIDSVFQDLIPSGRWEGRTCRGFAGFQLGPVPSRRQRNVQLLADLGEPHTGDAVLLGEVIDRLCPDLRIQLLATEDNSFPSHGFTEADRPT
jgi:hypothetical protein